MGQREGGSGEGGREGGREGGSGEGGREGGSGEGGREGGREGGSRGGRTHLSASAGECIMRDEEGEEEGEWEGEGECACVGLWRDGGMLCANECGIFIGGIRSRSCPLTSPPSTVSLSTKS